MKKLLVFVAVLSLASVASADLVWNIVEVTAAEHTSRGLRAFDVSTIGTVATIPEQGQNAEILGDEFAATDGYFTGNLHQAWAFGALPSVGLGLSPWGVFISPEALSVDTHFEFDISSAATLSAAQPSEDFTAFSPAQTIASVDDEGNVNGSYTLGMGTEIKHYPLVPPPASANFAFAVPIALQQLVTPYAHVVVPADGNAHLSAIAVSSNGATVPIEHDFIPEPATLGLLAFGGIGALIRRRRR